MKQGDIVSWSSRNRSFLGVVLQADVSGNGAGMVRVLWSDGASFVHHDSALRVIIPGSLSSTQAQDPQRPGHVATNNGERDRAPGFKIPSAHELFPCSDRRC